MRVLYVALTRAKEKLIITGVEKDYKKSISKKEEILVSYEKTDEKNNINRNIIQKYLSYLDWIELVYLKRKEELKDILEVITYKKQELLKEVFAKEEKKEVNILDKLKNIDKKDIDKIKEKLNFKYGYKRAKNVLTKTSVTKIKNMKLDLEEDKAEYKTPEFLKEDIGLTSAQKGSLMHLIMQKLDEKVEYDENRVIELVKNLKEKKIISEKQEEAVDIEKVYNFTKSSIWKELKNAKEIQREKPFYINISVKEIYDEDIDENILVQGIIDLYYITDKDKVVLVDYKTDKVKDKKELVEKYKEQLLLYKKALEKALEKEVERVYIYSTYLSKEIELEEKC